MHIVCLTKEIWMKRYVKSLAVLGFCVTFLVVFVWADTEANSNISFSTKPTSVPVPTTFIDRVRGISFDDAKVVTFTNDSIATSASIIWTKYEGNPVLIETAGGWDASGTGFPSVIFSEGRYRLWYESGWPYRIGYASSSNGISWEKHSNAPVLVKGESGKWDSGHVVGPHAIFHDGVYKMWYIGIRHRYNTTDGASIGYATSTDGIHWNKYTNNPVLIPGPAGSWDSKCLWDSCVVTEGDNYKKWYSGYDGSNFRIGYATSTDGINWVKYPGNPVLDIGPPGSWDSRFIYLPDVIFNGNFYEMWYSGYDGSNLGIGYATSTDGIHWYKHADNPVLTTGPAGSWDGRIMLAPSVVAQVGIYKMWYSGAIDGTYRIGYATSTSGFSTISGQVTNNGNPVSNATISASNGYNVSTNDAGNYTLYGLVAGSYTVSPTTTGYFWFPASRTCVVPPDSRGQDFVGKRILSQSSPNSSDAVSFGDHITYTIYLASPQDTTFAIHNRIPTHTTYISDSLNASGNVVYNPTSNTISGTLDLTTPNSTTVSFAVQVGITGTVTLNPLIINRTCIYPEGGSLADCEWSEVFNFTFAYPVYMPILVSTNNLGFVSICGGSSPE
jgi:predicted GH43/DUF377 family glycosyl hydrolase